LEKVPYSNWTSISSTSFCNTATCAALASTKSSGEATLSRKRHGSPVKSWSVAAPSLSQSMNLLCRHRLPADRLPQPKKLPRATRCRRRHRAPRASTTVMTCPPKPDLLEELGCMVALLQRRVGRRSAGLRSQPSPRRSCRLHIFRPCVGRGKTSNCPPPSRLWPMSQRLLYNSRSFLA
jgi:hypothetical protein